MNSEEPYIPPSLSVHCCAGSYNKINGVYACENNQTLNVELKGYGRPRQCSMVYCARLTAAN